SRGGGRLAGAARRALHRDHRALQPGDEPAAGDDRSREGAGVDRQGSAGFQHRKEAHRIGPEAGGVTDAKQLSHAAAVGVAVKDLVEYVAKALVDEPEQVNVTEVEGERVTVIELRVAQTDLGKVIGKQGRTARALRTILNANATKLRKRAVLEIVE